MSDSSVTGARFEQAFEIYGVHIAIGAPEPDLLSRLIGLLPPGLQRSEPEAAEARFTLVAVDDETWSCTEPNSRHPSFSDLALVIGILDTALRRYVADRSPHHVFVHAGAVGHGGRAIVLPGNSFAGKSTLVAELVRAGAEYYSDEYAVIDRRGLVHPFARPLSIRRPASDHADRRSVESLGGAAGAKPLPVGVVATTAYRPEASFRPQRRSTAQGVLALLAHSSHVREHPGTTMAAVRNAASSAIVLEGDRGEASAAAEALLELADRAAANGLPRPVRRRDEIGPHDVAFEVYGTRARITVPTAELAEPIVERFPMHAVPTEPRPGDRPFALEVDGDRYTVVEDGVVRARLHSLESGLARLRYELFYYATHHARDHLVISAAAVGHEGRAIVLPGAPRAGKTVLLAALLRAGAVYYADDWVVLDPDGLVRPYPTTFPLEGRKVSAKDIGATVGETPIPVGLIAKTEFRERARWNPQWLTPAEGAQMLEGHAYGRDNPAAATRIAETAAARAVVLEGERGEAEAAAEALLEIAAQSRVGGSS